MWVTLKFSYLDSWKNRFKVVPIEHQDTRVLCLCMSVRVKILIVKETVELDLKVEF